jgi:hypothetical protein
MKANGSELQKVKIRLGGLKTLDYTAHDLPKAHRLLGVDVRQQVQKILKCKLDTWDEARFRKIYAQSQACIALLTEKAADTAIDHRLRAAIGEYFQCLAAWGEGAGLDGIKHPALAAFHPLDQVSLVMFLQNDCTGCQTGLFRVHDGSVVMWHTEEDVEEQPGSSFDSLRIADFNVGDQDHPVVMHAFIYPDLLPGPAFGWRSDGFAQGVDKLPIRDFPDLTRGILANVVTWLTLRLGPSVDIREVIESLQPYYDGYALSTVRIQQGFVQADKHEFAADRIISSHLDERPDSYLFQVNIFNDRAHPWVAELEDLPPDWCRLYEQRMERTLKAIKNKDSKPGAVSSMRFFFDMITSQDGDGWAYANQDVKAYFIHRQCLQRAETWLGDGPALPDDTVSVRITLFD